MHYYETKQTYQVPELGNEDFVGTTVHRYAYNGNAEGLQKALVDNLHLINSSVRSRANKPLKPSPKREVPFDPLRPIHLAIMKDHPDCVKILKKAGSKDDLSHWKGPKQLSGFTFQPMSKNILIALQYKSFKTLNYLLKNVRTEDLYITASVRSGGYYSQETYLAFPYLYFALLTQNKKLVDFFINKKAVKPDITCFNVINSRQSSHALGPVEFMIKCKLPSKFILEYIEKYLPERKEKELGKLWLSANRKDLIEYVEHERPELATGLNEESLNKAAQKGHHHTLRYLIQNMVGFNQETLFFKCGYIADIDNKNHCKEMMECANGLFRIPKNEKEKKAYLKTIKKANHYKIIDDNHNSPLMECLIKAIHSTNPSVLTSLNWKLPEPSDNLAGSSGLNDSTDAYLPSYSQMKKLPATTLPVEQELTQTMKRLSLDTNRS